MNRGVDPTHAAPPEASVILVSTDELHHLEMALPTVLANKGCFEVIVVDNASSDGTGEYLATHYPDVRVIRTEQRMGYASANNLGFTFAKSNYLVVLNPDTCVAPDFVAELIRASHQHSDQALITSLIYMYDQPEEVNTCGNVVHFSMIAGCRGIGQTDKGFQSEEDVASISGCAFLVPRSLLERLGGFDEATFLYLEDTELSLRAWIYGFNCRTCPTSRVYHKYSIRLSPMKFMLIERNRWIVMTRIYHWRTLVLIAPALGLVELLSWAIAIRMGRKYVAAKTRSIWSFWKLAPSVLASRKQIQAARVRTDRELMSVLQGDLPVAQLITGGWLGKAVLTGANVFLTAYFGIVRGLVR